MINEAIILAGGFGTRLTSVKDVPKSMAPINEIPFLQILLDDLIVKGISSFHLAVGYQHQVVMDYFGSSYMGCRLSYTIEDEPLGTGGAIKKALENMAAEHVFVMNGDTFFDVDLEAMHEKHIANNADVTVALKPMVDFDRYGSVEYDENMRIVDFSEKKFYQKGAINGGIYLLDRDLFKGLNFPERFSMEQDFFELYCSEKKFYGHLCDGYFIDIGIPEDYTRAQEELPNLY